MNNKKAVEMSIAVIITIALLLIFLVIYGVFWKGAFGKTSGSLDNQIALTGDKDEDGVINLEDICPCVFGSITAKEKGCPDNPTPDQKSRTCLTKT
jgi:hypothetical protein